MNHETLPAQSPVDVNVRGGELYMCATDYEHELGEASGGTGVYASVADLKACRPCVTECGIVAVRVEFVRYVELGIPYSERGEETPNVRNERPDASAACGGSRSIEVLGGEGS